jgi:small subunit ribosomal protein S11
LAKQDTRKTMVKKPTIIKNKKKTHRNVSSGIAHVSATFSNTIISITDLAGNTITASSAGSVGYTGSRKSSAFAANMAAEDAAKRAITISGMKEVEVNLSGPGTGRESAVKGLRGGGLEVTFIRDVTPISHNGCRAPKRRRV